MSYSFNIKSINSDIIEADSDCLYINDDINKPLARIFKRLLDILLSLAFLVLIAPWLFPLVALAIIIESKGNPFFVQKRTGKNRHTFYCIKFRTMFLNDDANRLQVQVNDARITKVGKFLRESHIDELPQVINVLFGQMSIVGPRPHMLRHNVEYAQLSPNYHVRHTIKPGLTGLAQVRGYHGMIENREDYKNRLNSDLEYIHNWSLIGDVEIFFLTTFKIMFRIE